MVPYKHTSHIFHFIMTFLTGGAWLLVWLVCWASNNQYNKQIDRMAFYQNNQRQQQPTIIYVERNKQE